MARVHELVQHSLLALLSAYFGSLFTIVLFSLSDGISKLNNNDAVMHSSIQGALILAAFPLAAMLIGGTGVVIFLILANTCPRNSAPTVVAFLVACVAAGVLGILIPLPVLWAPAVWALSDPPSQSEWRLYVFGACIAFVSGCVLLVIERAFAKKGITTRHDR